jgi:glycosyltransferase involved in cell wall biosynthesis
VVPVHDEEHLLPGCLDAVDRAADRAREAGTRVDVIVVLDACRDGSARIAAARPGVHAVTVDVRAVGAARALGCRVALERASAPSHRVWLAGTDADSQVPPDWLIHQARLADRGWDAVLGTVDVRDWTDWAGRAPGLAAAYDARYAAGRVGADGHRHVHGTNLGVRGSAYLAAGGYPEQAGDEDVDLVAALRRGGSPVLATSRIPVVTSARPSARAPRGFAGYLAGLEARLAEAPESA